MANFDTCSGKIHMVGKGDTLYKLSKMYQCSLCDIISANPYVNVYNMQMGEEICIPVKEREEETKGTLTYVATDGDVFENAFMYFGVGPKELFEQNPSLAQVPLPAGLELTAKKLADTTC